ncbi:hypothetical protein DSECCO2_514050 [anaerobic digester metagenome]
MHVDHRVGPVARDERVARLVNDTDLVEPRGEPEELGCPVTVRPIPGADESELPHRHEIAALERPRRLHCPGNRDAEDLPEEPGDLGLPCPLPLCRAADDETAGGRCLLVAHEVEVCKRFLPQDSDVHPAGGTPPAHVDDRVQEQEGEEVQRVQGIGVLLHTPPGLRHLPHVAPDGDGLVRPIDEPPTHRRVAIGCIENRLLEPEHPDPELFPERALESVVLPPRLVAAERPFVERCVRLKQPEEHLDPRAVNGHRPEPLPLRPHARRHPAHLFPRGAAKK